MRIAMNPAIEQHRQEEWSNHDPEQGRERGREKRQDNHCQHNSARNLQHVRIPRTANIAWLVAATLLLSCIFPAIGNAQNSRYDYFAATTTGSGNLLPLLVIPGATVNFYTGCTSLPCSTYANVYNSASGASSCPTTAQIVLNDTSVCVAVADGEGNFGGWFLPGQYQYTITAFSATYGPYSFTIGYNSGSFSLPISIANGGTGQTTAAAALAALGGFPLNSLPISIGNGGTGQTTGIAALNALGAASGTTPIAFGNPLTAPQLRAGGSPWYDITAAPYNAVAGATDNGTAIRAAISAAIAAGGGTVFFPCGTWKVATPADSSNYAALDIYPGTVGITLLGAQPKCANITYAGATSVQGVLNVAYSKPPTTWNGSVATPLFGFDIVNLGLQGTYTSSTWNTQDSLDMIRPAESRLSKVMLGQSVQGACAHIYSGVGMTYDTIMCDTNNWTGGIRPTNGVILDGYSGAGDQSSTSTFTTPSIEGLNNGVGLWLKEAGNITVTGGQIAGSGRNLQIDSISSGSNGNQFTSTLFETGSASTSNILVSSNNNTFTSTTFSNGGGTNLVEIAGSQNAIISPGAPTGTLQIDSSAVGTRVQDFDGFGMTITDNGVGTIYDGSISVGQSTTDLAYNAPQFQRQTPSSMQNLQSGAHFDQQTVAHGMWVAGFNSTAISMFTPANYTTGKAWTAIFIGSWICGATYTNGGASMVQRSDSNPSYTAGSCTYTFSTSGGKFTIFSASAFYAGFSGWVFFMPNNGFAAGSGTADAINLIGSIDTVSVRGQGNATYAAGTGVTVSGCSSGFVCDSHSGQFGLSTGATVPALFGNIVTVILGGFTRPSNAVCSITLLNSGTGAPVSVAPLTTTTSVEFQSVVATITPSTSYVGTYICN